MTYTNEELNNDVEILDKVDLTIEEKLTLQKIVKSAESGIYLSSTARRMVFGFSLAEAVENWLHAFNPTLEKPINEQLPAPQTKDLVAAWVSFSFRRTALLFILSISVTLVTTFFLYKQNTKQDLLIESQREIDNREKRYLYLKTLFDEDCSKSDIESFQSNYCQPVENGRARAEAARAYLAIQLNDSQVEEVDLSFAHLEGTNLQFFNRPRHKKGINLFRANFRAARLTSSDLSDTTLAWVDFGEANLSNATMEGADLTESSLDLANLDNAVLRGADMSRTSLFGVVNLTCDQLKSAINWQMSYRGEKFACGAKIPKFTGYIDTPVD